MRRTSLHQRTRHGELLHEVPHGPEVRASSQLRGPRHARRKKFYVAHARAHPVRGGEEHISAPLWQRVRRPLGVTKSPIPACGFFAASLSRAPHGAGILPMFRSRKAGTRDGICSQRGSGPWNTYPVHPPSSQACVWNFFFFHVAQPPPHERRKIFEAKLKNCSAVKG